MAGNLEKFDKMQARLVELRFLGGLTIEEAAHELKIARTTVKRKWTVAKAWLKREISRKNDA